MSEVKIVKNSIKKGELKEIAAKQYGDMVKAVVDIEKGIMAIGGEFHIDMQTFLSDTEKSSGQNTWGINLYVDKSGDDFIEFDSMINLKPAYNNRSRNVESKEIQDKIRDLVIKLVK